MNAPKEFPCQLCGDTFLSLPKFNDHMSWHDEMSKKRASKQKTPSATEMLGITKEPTIADIKEINIQLPGGEFARPRLADVMTPAPCVPSPVTTPTPAKPKAIELLYKYVGDCPDCGAGVETIEVVLPEKNAVNAYCIRCKKNIKQQLVLPINKQK